MKILLFILMLSLAPCIMAQKDRCLIIKQKGGNYGAVDRKGNEIIPFNYMSLQYSSEHTFIARGLDGYYGFLDGCTGEVLVPTIYSNGWFFSNGLAAIKKYMVGSGFVNKKNELVIPCIYYDVGQGFNEGLAAVNKPNPIRGGNQPYGYIDTLGNEIIPFQFYTATTFNEGMALVQNFEYKYGFIGPKGDTIIPFIYDDVAYSVWDDDFIDKYGFGTENDLHSRICWFHEGLLAVKKDRLWGFIDKTGKTVIPFDYYRAKNFKNGMAEVSYIGSEAGPRPSFWIDKTGKCVKDCEGSK